MAAGRGKEAPYPPLRGYFPIEMGKQWNDERGSMSGFPTGCLFHTNGRPGLGSVFPRTRGSCNLAVDGSPINQVVVAKNATTLLSAGDINVLCKS